MIRSEDRDSIRIITLDRPQKRNAIDTALGTALLEALDAAAGDDSVQGIVLAGSGPGFCAGADLKEMQAVTDPAAKEARAALTVALLDAPARIPKPVIAAIHGAALGAGAALALECDLAVMADTAQLGWPEAKHRIMPGLVAPGLIRRVPRAIAFDLLATGRPVAAAEAVALHLAHRVVPEAELLDAACALARAAALLPPAMLGALKRMIAEPAA